MNIGVDVDGVLEDIELFFKNTGERYFSETYGLNVVDPDAYRAEERFGCTAKQRKMFWAKCGRSYLVDQPCMDGCSEVLKQFILEGHKIFIITSRAMTIGKGPVSLYFRRVLRRWLKKNDIEYDKIVFCRDRESAEDKFVACIENGIDIMIDDTVDNLLAIKDCVTALCYESPWNKTLDDSKIIKVSDWQDILEVVESY